MCRLPPTEQMRLCLGGVTSGIEVKPGNTGFPAFIPVNGKKPYEDFI